VNVTGGSIFVVTLKDSTEEATAVYKPVSWAFTKTCESLAKICASDDDTCSSDDDI